MIERLPRRSEAHALAVDEHLPLVGAVEAGDDLRERGLARAVLADQGVDGSGTDSQVDVPEYGQTAEGLTDVPQLDGELRDAGVSRLVRHGSTGPLAGELVNRVGGHDPVVGEVGERVDISHVSAVP